MNQIDVDYYDWLVSQIEIPNGKDYGDHLLNAQPRIRLTVPNDNKTVRSALCFAGDKSMKSTFLQ